VKKDLFRTLGGEWGKGHAWFDDRKKVGLGAGGVIENKSFFPVTFTSGKTRQKETNLDRLRGKKKKSSVVSE